MIIHHDFHSFFRVRSVLEIGKPTVASEANAYAPFRKPCCLANVLLVCGVGVASATTATHQPYNGQTDS